MPTKSIYWSGTGGDAIHVTYSGSGDQIATIESDPNLDTSSRTKDITFKTNDGKASKKITVMQAGASGYIKVLSPVTLASAGGSFEYAIRIDANVNWKFDAVTYPWGDGSTDTIILDKQLSGPGVQYVMVTTQVNSTGSNRSRTLTVKSADGSISHTFTIQQTKIAAGEFILSPEDYEMHFDDRGYNRSGNLIITAVGNALLPRNSSTTHTFRGSTRQFRIDVTRTSETTAVVNGSADRNLSTMLPLPTNIIITSEDRVTTAMFTVTQDRYIPPRGGGGGGGSGGNAPMHPDAADQ